MTLEEAIFELEIMNHDGFVVMRYLEHEALRLGIEALKRVNSSRKYVALIYDGLLPGETKD